MSIEIRGADQLAILSKALKDAGAKDLQRELSKGISQALKPLRNDLRQSARSTLPKQGGLGESVAASQMRIIRRMAGIRFQTSNQRRSLRTLDQGTVRHPVFGNRSNWVTQTVPPNWYSKPIHEAEDEIRQEVQAVISRVMAKIERST